MSDKKRSGLFWPLTFAAVSCGFLYLVFLIPDTGPDFSASTTDSCGNPITAYVMSQEPVKSFLKSPSSASFPSYSDSGVDVIVDENCVFNVAGYVDAENSFGAEIRTPFTAKMATDGKSWTALDVQLT